MTARNFVYRLFFTKDDALDSSQLVLIALYCLFGFVVVNTSRGVWSIPADVLQSLIWVMGLASIQAAPQWLALSWMQSRLLLARTAAIVATGEPLPTDDGRG